MLTTEQIWQDLSTRLRMKVCSRVADDQLADDLLQETFLRIHDGLGTLRVRERVAPWVYRIARNAIADYYRRDRGKQQVDGAALDDFAEADASVLEALSGCIYKMVHTLPDRYKEALILSELEELTQREVGERLGLSLSGAKSRVQRGREKLKEKLLCCCHFELDRWGGVADYMPRANCGCAS